MSVVLSAFYIFVCCSKLVASIPFPEEFVRKYLAAANGELALKSMQGQLQNQQTGINPSHMTAYAGQINNAHSQPIYSPIPNAGNYYQPSQNVGMNLNLPNNYDRDKYAGLSPQASAQVGNVYPQIINPNTAWEQDFYRNQLLQQQNLQQIHGQNYQQQIPFDQQLITRSQIQQTSTNPPINLPTQSYVSPMNIQQIQKNQIIRENAPDNRSFFSSINNDEIKRKQLNAAVQNEKLLRSNTQQQEMQQEIMNNPNIQNIISKTKLKKRYLVVHPDGTVKHVDSLDEVIRENPNYILLNSGRIKALSSTYAQATTATADSSTAPAAASTTNKPEPKPLDIKQFRVTEVTSSTKKAVLPKVLSKSRNSDKRFLSVNKSKKEDEHEKIVSVESKASDTPIKVTVKSNKNGDVVVTSATTSDTRSKPKNHNKVQKVSSATRSKTASKPSLKFSVKKTSNFSKNSNKDDVPSSTSSKVVISKNKKIVSSESKSSSSSRKRNSASSYASANASSADKNKKDSNHTPKLRVNANQDKAEGNKATATAVTSNKRNKTLKPNVRGKKVIATASAVTSTKRNKTSKPKERSKKVITTASVVTSNKKIDNKREMGTINTHNTKRLRNKVNTKSKSLEKSKNPLGTKQNVKINEKTNGKTKMQTEHEKKLKVIPVIKGKSTATNSIVGNNDSALRTSSENLKKKINIGKGKSTTANSIVGSNDSALRTSASNLKKGNIVVLNSSETKDSKEDTAKMMELLKGIDTEEMKDKVIILLVMPPIVDRELHTTIYPDGTIIDELTETTWDSDDEDAEPKVVTRTKIRHVNDPPANKD